MINTRAAPYVPRRSASARCFSPNGRWCLSPVNLSRVRAVYRTGLVQAGSGTRADRSLKAVAVAEPGAAQ